MTDLNVSIGTKGDVTGLKQLETGYQKMAERARQALKTFQERSPGQIAADRLKVDTKMTDLERRASAIESKILGTKLDIAEKTITGKAGKERIQELQNEQLRVNYERATLNEQRQEIIQRRQDGRRGIIAPMMGTGRFVASRALKYGGIAAGAMGAFSFLSNIFEKMDAADEINRTYAEALDVTRGRHGFDYTRDVVKPFFEFKQVLKDVGQTVRMTSKDMIPMLDVAKELGDFSGGRRGTVGGELVELTNIGRTLGVQPELISQLITGGLRLGAFRAEDVAEFDDDIFERREQYGDIVKMILMNQNMMHRAAESLQAMSQVMSSTVHGTTGLNAFGIFNLLDTLNRSEFPAYRGAGGARALMDIDRAFRAGGNQNLQYFQTLALTPGMQARNAEMLKEWQQGLSGRSRQTDYATGYYDQIIADMFKELGAFATPADLIKQFSKLNFKEAAEYAKNKFPDKTKMNIERLFDQYRIAYGNETEGQRMFMTYQLAEDLGISPFDVGVLERALSDKVFMEHSKRGKLSTQEMTDLYTKFVESGRKMPVLEDYRKARQEKDELFLETAKSIKAVTDKVLPEFLRIGGDSLRTIAEHVPKIADGIVSITKFFFPTEETTREQMDTEFLDRSKKAGRLMENIGFGGINLSTSSKSFSELLNRFYTTIREGAKQGIKDGIKDMEIMYPSEPGSVPLS